MCLACASLGTPAAHELLNATLEQPWRRVGPTGQGELDALLAGTAWRGGPVTFGFPTSASDYEAGHIFKAWLPNLTPFGPALRDAARLVLTGEAAETAPGWRTLAVEDFTLLGFEEAPGAEATLRFGVAPLVHENGQPFDGIGAFPGAGGSAGDVLLGTLTPDPDPGPGEPAFYILVHEIGHALGLKHPFETRGRFPSLDPARDTIANSIMSYTTAAGSSEFPTRLPRGEMPQSWMQLDIAALQHLYGINWAFRAADTVYRWDMATGEMSVDGTGQGVPADRGAPRVFATLWDGGGRDRLDLSNAPGAIRADLNPGGWITFSEALLAELGLRNQAGGLPAVAPGNIALARAPRDDSRAFFEDVTGGAGADTLGGNRKANLLSGGGGGDLLEGLGGADTLEGGFGADTLRGGEGRDTARYGDGRIWLDLTDPASASGEALGDVLEGIEVLIFGAGASRLRGGSGAEAIFAGAGADTLVAGAGDTLDGGAGVDWFVLPDHDAGAGGLITVGVRDSNTGDYAGMLLRRFEVWHLGAGQDTLLGGSVAETVRGMAGDDVLSGAGGSDDLSGGEGDDTLAGGTGHDRLTGAAGSDELHGGAGNDTLFGNSLFEFPGIPPSPGEEDNLLRGEDGNDSLTGSRGADTLEGGSGHDELIGRDMADLLRGESGADTLEGGAAADTLDGGAGSDLALLLHLFVPGEEGGASFGATIDLRDQAANAGSAAGMRFVSVERFRLTDLEDAFRGSSVAEAVDGGAGADTLRGGGGADTLTSGDTIDEEGEALSDPDLFVFANPREGADLILGFTATGEEETTDRIGLVGAGFGGLAAGDLPAARFVAGAAPVGPGGFGTLLYDTSTGALSWDADGSGAAAARLLATLSGAPALTAAEIVIL